MCYTNTNNKQEKITLPLLFFSFKSFETVLSLLYCAATGSWITAAAVHLVYELFFLTFVSQHGWPLDISCGKTPACLPFAAAERLLKAPASCVQKIAPPTRITAAAPRLPVLNSATTGQCPQALLGQCFCFNSCSVIYLTHTHTHTHSLYHLCL